MPLANSVPACLGACGQLGKMTMKKQTTYQKATQDRINFTSQVIGSIKSVKMLGYTERFTNLISQARENDIHAGKDFRKISVWVNGLGRLLRCFASLLAEDFLTHSLLLVTGGESISHVATFGAYAIISKITGGDPFSASQAITVLSILDVLLVPLSELSGTLPRSFGTVACFKRIQDFLLLDERRDTRAIRPQRQAIREIYSTQEDGIELSEISRGAPEAAAISIVDGVFKWGNSAVLTDINTSIPTDDEGSLTFVIGSVGAGKSSFLKAVLGETSSASGIVSLSSSDIAFCDQTPWMMNATIKENIIAESRGFDEPWFNTVVDACDLSQDLARLVKGADTIVGDKGLKLSGGQKQRLVSLRRYHMS